MDKTGSSATRAKNKYNTANYDRLYPYVPRGRKAIYEAAAERVGLSLNEFITQALDEKVEKTKSAGE